MYRSARTVRSVLAGAVAGLATLALVGAGTPVTAAPAPAADKPVATGLLSPLSLAVARDGTVYYTENFGGTLYAKAPGKKAEVLFRAKKRGSEVGAVGVSREDGVVSFAVTSPKGQTDVYLINRNHGDRLRHLGDLDAFEKKRNPDRGVAYGLRDVDAACAAQFPAKGMPAKYQGVVESHPYATLPQSSSVGDGIYIADAAANAVFAIGGGKIRTVAVLPPVPTKVTPELAETMKMPDCAIGQTYWFESVPTDVEMGPRDENLYVTTLPGGPEDGSMAGLASVYSVDPDRRSPTPRKLVGGLTSATGLAVSPKGDLYVAQLFAGSIVKVAKGTKKAKPFARAMLPGDVEWTRQGIWATTGVLTGLEPGSKPAGKVALIRF